MSSKTVKKVEIALSDNPSILGRATVHLECGVKIRNFRIRKSSFENEPLWIEEPKHRLPNGKWISDFFAEKDVWQVIKDEIAKAYAKEKDVTIKDPNSNNNGTKMVENDEDFVEAMKF